MPSLRRAFRSKVGVRMASLFFLCAGLPLAILAVLTINRTTADLEDRARQRLQYEARNVGQESLGRLELLTRSLALLGTGVLSQAGNPDDLVRDLFNPMPPALIVLPDDSPAVRLAGELALTKLSQSEEQHLNDWGALIAVDATTSRAALVVRVASSKRQGLAAAVIDERWLFGLDSDDSLPPDTTLCVRFTATTPQCSSDIGTEALAEALTAQSGATLDLDVNGQSFLARTGHVSLKARYLTTTSWTILLMRPRNVIRAPVAGFIYDFWLVTFLGMLAAGWLSLTQVRRQLRPLEALTEGASRLAHRNFDETIEVRSGDEFEILGESFNSLSIQLRRQFAELEAFNLGTLSALGRAIDAKSPWTAGHSERVTAVAVAIAKAMRLPVKEIEELRRGGLVHDLGKIATPREILDKPARLTPEEERVMRLHPATGVHILQPIAAFEPLLPIVGQHHEHWNGQGYPNGLSGEAIGRTARVLAVADVCDALRSDRPYRSGMALDRVISLIVAGAGRQFDPAVVDGFLKIVPRLDDIAHWRQAIPNPAAVAAAEAMMIGAGLAFRPQNASNRAK